MCARFDFVHFAMVCPRCGDDLVMELWLFLGRCWTGLVVSGVGLVKVICGTSSDRWRVVGFLSSSVGFSGNFPCACGGHIILAFMWLVLRIDTSGWEGCGGGCRYFCGESGAVR